MANISLRIRLFNESYRIAWQRLTMSDEKTAPSDLAVRLSENIQALIKAGYEDVDAIVDETVRRMS
ncbi:hypothetical protein ASD45_13445 [Pseudolabrys sp. Root1462]|uniref:hypothetical protein n=1 Tax=Pseudolabrys sp. Root1462 TaxID=1736466 RepID=UPI000703978B|nr:hypothetical protein [Pseudolabrys sp. Root1462]KQZ01746.1 hypothetical protein ASD45_13445 [Pseudolabrys sp. Root1462]